MVAMPYILVDIVLGELSLLFFCITTAALLSRWPLANLWLPALLRNRKTLVFVAYALALIVIVRVMASLGRVSLFTPFISDVFSFIGLMNSVVLAYQFLDKRYFLNRSEVQRRFLLAIVSVVMTFVPFLAVVTAVVGLFVIK
jgi:hypothetical protein